MAKIKHVLVYLNGELSLMVQKEDGGYEEIVSNPSAALGSTYRQLKALSHIAVTLNILTEENQPQVQLKRFHEKLKQLIFNHESELLPYRYFINQSIWLTNQVLEQWDDKETCHRLVVKYNEVTSTLLSEYAKEAARLQVESLNALMLDWSEKYSIKPEGARVLIVCPHGPREGLIEQQFFDSWVQRYKSEQSLSTKGLIYMVEMLPEQMASLRKIDDLIFGFLSKQEINKAIGKKLLKDEHAMFKDILAEYAESALQSVVKEKKSGSCPYQI